MASSLWNDMIVPSSKKQGFVPGVVPNCATEDTLLYTT
jgi:hypothetical protein